MDCDVLIYIINIHTVNYTTPLLISWRTILAICAVFSLFLHSFSEQLFSCEAKSFSRMVTLTNSMIVDTISDLLDPCSLSPQRCRDLIKQQWDQVLATHPETSLDKTTECSNQDIIIHNIHLFEKASDPLWSKWVSAPGFRQTQEGLGSTQDMVEFMETSWNNNRKLALLTSPNPLSLSGWCRALCNKH